MEIRDPIVNVIYEGIKREIQLTLDAGCLRAPVLLTYSGIDAMAYLGMPASQDDVKGADFIDWCNKYMRFPCVEQLTGADLYGARCAALHNYGAVSRMSREGKCRIIVYGDKFQPEVIFNPAVNATLVFVSIPALAEAFFRGIDRFLPDLFSDPARGKVAEQRMHSNSLNLCPFNPAT